MYRSKDDTNIIIGEIEQMRNNFLLSIIIEFIICFDEYVLSEIEVDGSIHIDGIDIFMNDSDDGEFEMQ